MSGINETNDEDLWSCDYATPTAWEVRKLIGALGPRVIATMVVPCVLLLVMWIMFVEEVMFLVRNNIKWKVTSYKIWVLSAYPVMSLLCILQLFMPRSADVISYTSSFYFVIVVKKYFSYILYIYGGKHGLINCFKYKTSVNSHPFPCCYCFWCKRGPMTMKRLHMLQALMYHALVFYPFVYFLQTLLRAEDLKEGINKQLIFAGINFSATISSFVCLYSLSIIYKSSRIPLQQFFIKPKYQSIQGIIIFDTIQSTLMRVCGMVDIIPCGFPYPNPNKSGTLQQYILVVELFICSLLARFAYRRTDADAKVVPYPPVDEYGKELPVTAIKLDGPVKMLELNNPYYSLGSAGTSLVTIGPYNSSSSDEFRIQINSSDSNSPYFNDCFIPDF